MEKKDIRAWVLLAAVTVVGVTVDLVTKEWAENTLARGQQVRLVGTTLSFVLVYNKGAAFGINPQRWLPWFPLNLFFAVFTVVAVALILAYYHRAALRDRLVQWGLALVLPGALGNLFDRLVRPTKGVVDFIMVDLNVWPADPWPVFNVADICVTFGVGFMLASLIRDEWRRHRPRAAPAAEADSSAGDDLRSDSEQCIGT